MKTRNILVVTIWLCVSVLLNNARCNANELDSIAQAQTIKVGVREGAFPFAFFDASGKPGGLTVDLCNRIIEDIKTSLKVRDLRIEYIPVKSQDRLPFLQQGKISMECGSSTNTKDRQEKLSVSYNFFYAGVRMMTKRQSGLQEWQELGGRKVALQKGTTAIGLFQGVSKLRGLSGVTIVDVSSAKEGYDSVANGTADAFVTDDSLLYAQISANKGLEVMLVTGKPLSVEPYTILMRKEDVALRTAVNKALIKLFSNGEFNSIYNKWLQTTALTIPMSSMLKDSFRQPSDFYAYPW
jgi:glutamate/aspartate transport system substrate-binding protein